VIYAGRYLLAFAIIVLAVWLIAMLLTVMAPAFAAIGRAMRVFFAAQMERTRRIWNGGDGPGSGKPPAPAAAPSPADRSPGPAPAGQAHPAGPTYL
jgi:hypothetical protein